MVIFDHLDPNPALTETTKIDTEEEKRSTMSLTRQPAKNAVLISNLVLLHSAISHYGAETSYQNINSTKYGVFPMEYVSQLANRQSTVFWCV